MQDAIQAGLDVALRRDKVDPETSSPSDTTLGLACARPAQCVHRGHIQSVRRRILQDASKFKLPDSLFFDLGACFAQGLRELMQAERVRVVEDGEDLSHGFACPQMGTGRNPMPLCMGITCGEVCKAGGGVMEVLLRTLTREQSLHKVISTTPDLTLPVTHTHTVQIKKAVDAALRDQTATMKVDTELLWAAALALVAEGTIVGPFTRTPRKAGLAADWWIPMALENARAAGFLPGATRPEMQVRLAALCANAVPWEEDLRGVSVVVENGDVTKLWEVKAGL